MPLTRPPASAPTHLFTSSLGRWPGFGIEGSEGSLMICSDELPHGPLTLTVLPEIDALYVAPFLSVIFQLVSLVRATEEPGSWRFIIAVTGSPGSLAAA